MVYYERRVGEIYKFTSPKPDAEHPFAVLGRIDKFNYLGCMITHGDPHDWVDNLPMQPDYFEMETLGVESPVVHSVNQKGIQSHFMRVGLRKAIDLDVRLAGRLTEKGLEYLRSIVRKTAPEEWKEYKRYARAQKRQRIHIAMKKMRKGRQN